MNIEVLLPWASSQHLGDIQAAQRSPAGACSGQRLPPRILKWQRNASRISSKTTKELWMLIANVAEKKFVFEERGVCKTNGF